MNELIIDSLVTIGNHKKVIKECEPNIMQSMRLNAWMVVRVLKALELFENEWERLSEDTRGEIQQTEIPT